VTLHRDLELRLTRTPFGVRLVDHPLLVAPASEERYAEYNARYTRQREQFDRAVAAGDWEGALDLVRERHAWAFLWEHRDHFAPDAYWAHLARLWTGAECFWPVEELLPRMLAHHAGQRSHFMYARERGELDSMPELFRVYRGHVWGEWRGWSWTLSPKVACSFAGRYDDTLRAARESRWPMDDDDEEPRPGVVTGLVRKEDVIGLLLRREECEVVVRPSLVRRVRPYHRAAPDDAPHQAEALAALRVAEAAFRLHGDSLHGRQHWLRVDANAVELCRRVPGADLLVCRLFAFLHDCRRNDDDSDPGHGRRAARFIEEHWGAFMVPLSKVQRKKLLSAVRHHQAGRVSDDPTVGVCWDSDRVDLVRVGTFPEDEYLSTAAARELKWVL